MGSRKRVLQTLAHEKPDRVPRDAWLGEDILEELKDYFDTNEEGVLRELGIDFRKVELEVKGSVFCSEGRKVFEDHFGARFIKRGVHRRYTYHPIDVKGDLHSYDFPRVPEQYLKAVTEEIDHHGDSFFTWTGINNVFKDAWILRGFSELMMDLGTDLGFVERLLDSILQYHRKLVSLWINTGIDMIAFIGDFASQQSMLISPDIFKTLFKPRIADLVDLCRKNDIYTMFHSDGNIEVIIPDIIEMGFDVLNPIQPECMDPEKIKGRFGDKIVLHGTLSLQQTLPFGTVDDVRGEVHDRIKNCGYGGGLILAPSNVVHSDVPVENLLAVYGCTD